MGDERHTPESHVDSGDASSSVAAAAHPAAPEEDGTPEPVDESPAPVAAEGEGQESETLDVDALIERAEKADEYLELAQRTRAEFENYRRRAVKEASAAQERGAAK